MVVVARNNDLRALFDDAHAPATVARLLPFCHQPAPTFIGHPLPALAMSQAIGNVC